jgi:hypothetical protein
MQVHLLARERGQPQGRGRGPGAEASAGDAAHEDEAHRGAHYDGQGGRQLQQLLHRAIPACAAGAAA